MEYVKIENIDLEISRVALGTWSIGGWLWGGSNDEHSFKTILSALDSGINIIDTAPVYGFGLSEEICGKAIKEFGNREEIIIATKLGLNWYNKKVFRDSSKKRILNEIDASLRRLDTEYIDIYQVHWPDESVPFEETADILYELLDKGKIKAIGVSNYSTEQMEAFRKSAPLHTCQPPYNLFEREIENDVLPFCKKHGIAVLAYGAICRGLLSGKMTKDREFIGDDIRKTDEKFQGCKFLENLDIVKKLDEFATINYHKSVLELSIRWLLDKGSDIALWGARKPEQLELLDGIWNWKLDDDAMLEIDNILTH